jgi:hypothetical protein
MFVLYSKDKRQSQDNQDKAVQKIYRESKKKKKIPPEKWMFVLCVVHTDKRQNAGQSRQRNKYV